MAAAQPAALVPKLRFPEFRSASSWKQDQIGNIARILKGKGVSKADIAEGGATPCIRYAELYTRYGEIIRVVEAATNMAHDDLFLSEAEDVIVPASGETRADIARAACVVPSGVALGSDLNILRSALHGPFFSYMLNSPLRYSIAKLAQGDTVAHLYPSQLSRVTLAIPSRPEQQKIADCLGSLDDLLAAEGRKLEALRQHKQALMQQLFPQPERTKNDLKIPAETAPRLRFPEFADGPEWRRQTLGQAATFLNGRAYSKDELLDSGKYRVLRVGNFFTNDHWYYSDLELDEDKYCDKGDLLYAWSASFGPRIWRGERVIYHYHIWKVIERRGIDRGFLYACLAFETQRMRDASARGLGMQHLTKAGIESWECAIPSDPDEQRRIAECLAAADAGLEDQVSLLDALQRHKRGLLQQLFPKVEESAP